MRNAGNDVETWTARIERVVPADPERVWRALTTDELAVWYWPESFHTHVVVDARVGGRFRIASESADLAVEGEYSAVEPLQRLVHTWRWDGDDDETLVTITLAPAPAGTLLVVLHERLVTDQDRDSHAEGWGSCLDRLVPHVGDPLT